MRRLFGWMAGLVGIAALARVLARRDHATQIPSPYLPPEPDPADELRRKLSESRAEVEPSGATRTGAEPAPAESLDERRARVHAKALEAIDEMREPQP